VSNFNEGNHTFSQPQWFGAAAKPNCSFSTPPPPSSRPGSVNDGNHSFSHPVAPTIIDYGQQHLEQRALRNLAGVSPQPIFPQFQQPAFQQQQPPVALGNRDAERAVILMILLIVGLVLGAYFLGRLIIGGLVRRFRAG
jgi:hypothetical protein